jgi:TPP-dependent pyruvate/acetoin dehydrogenase alpha subunit
MTTTPLKTLNQFDTDCLAAMLRIRRTEEEILKLLEQGFVPGFPTQSIGQEATAVGVVTALAASDVVFSNHRNRGHVIGRGSPIDGVLGEVRCLSTGTLGGRGGAMHLADPDVGIPYTSAIVGGGLSLAVGWALSSVRLRCGQQVVAAFFGDGVAEEGVFAEALNFAALWKLPILMICENNGMEPGGTRALEYPVSDLAAGTPVAVAKTYGITSTVVDGSDVHDVHQAAELAVGQIRREGGPYFIECRTVRWPGNKLLVPELTTGPLDVEMAWDESVIPDDHREWFLENDPVLLHIRKLDDGRDETRAYVRNLDDEIKNEVRAASQRISESPPPNPATAYEFI